MDRLRALAWFCKVVELQGISEAARALGVSKAVVSKYVAWLEDDLGARLLHRTTRVVRPTATGRAVHERARQLLDQMQELEGTAKAEKGQPVGARFASRLPSRLGSCTLETPSRHSFEANPAVQSGSFLERSIRAESPRKGSTWRSASQHGSKTKTSLPYCLRKVAW